MSRKFNVAFMALLAGVIVWLTPTAKADEWDKRTILTFSEPVEIPGQVLEPGTYVFKLADSTDRTIVQVFTEDEQHLIATIMAAAAYRVEPAGKTIVTFEERAAGAPQALHDWFYPGDNNGIEFLYPKAQQQYAAAVQTEPPAPAPPAPVETAAKPQETPAPQPATQQPAPVIVQQEEVLIAQAPPADNFAAEQTTPQVQEPALPHTAGNFAMILLLGIALLSAGFAVVRFAGNRI